MAIMGCKKWDDRATYSIQTNNAIETILSKKLAKGADGIPHGWLEDCGPTSAVNILDAMGMRTEITTPAGWKPQPEDVLSLWFSDPSNYDAERKARGDIDPAKYMGNEIPQYYVAAIPAVFGVPVHFFQGQTFEWVASMVAAGRGVQICLVNPGHFLGVVAYDDDKKELIYRDPWPGRNNGVGYNLRMGKPEFQENTEPYCLVYGA